MELKDAVQQFVLDKKDMRNFSKVAKERMEDLLGQKIMTEVRGNLLKKFGLEEAVKVCKDCGLPEDACKCDKEDKEDKEPEEEQLRDEPSEEKSEEESKEDEKSE